VLGSRAIETVRSSVACSSARIAWIRLRSAWSWPSIGLDALDGRAHQLEGPARPSIASAAIRAQSQRGAPPACHFAWLQRYCCKSRSRR
jgi:hypothetical protein